MKGLVPEEERRSPVCTFLIEPRVPCRSRLCPRNPAMCEPSCKALFNASALACRAVGQEKEIKWDRNLVFLDHVHGGVADNILKNYKATTGFKAVAYAIHHCENVDLYGFGPSCAGETGVEYFQSPVTPFLWHRYSQEVSLLEQVLDMGPQLLNPHFQNWVRAKNVTMHAPECWQGLQGKTAEALPHRIQLSNGSRNAIVNSSKLDKVRMHLRRLVE